MSQQEIWSVVNENFVSLKKETKDIVDKSGKDEPWYDGFSPKMKNYFSKITSESKNKVMSVKVKFSSFTERGLLTSNKQTDKDQILSHKLHFFTELFRKVQTLVKDHGVALEYLRDLLNLILERVEKTEENFEKTEQKVEKIKDNIRSMVEDVNGPQTHVMIEEQTRELNLTVKDLKKNVKKLTDDKETLEKEVDEARQREMKGNLILTSPHKPHKPSLLIKNTTDEGGSRRQESSSEMCRRVIKNKTGVRRPLAGRLQSDCKRSKEKCEKTD